MVLAFDEFEVDPDRFELRADGVPIQLEPQVFEVLVHLARHPGRVVTKQELLDEVWGSRFVSESALTSRIKTARQALGDDGRTQRYIRTVHGRGYRFLGDVRNTDANGTNDGGEPGGDGFERNNLPVERTPLFGRDDDIETVATELRSHRLVSLLGIGGVGKTRLAISSARRAEDQFPDAVWFVDLVPVTDASSLELALAATAGLSLSTTEPMREQLARLLSARRALIVFDNAEHIAVEVAALVDVLLIHTTELRILVTSRVPLGLLDERRLAVEPLPFHLSENEATSSPAVALLTSAARRFDAPLDAVEPTILQRICRSLDGLPLAIELAAAQLRHLDASAVADRLDRRFDVLASRAHPERHASLQAVLGDTWDALDASERTLLEQLAAFPATFTLDDLDALAGVDPDAALVEIELGLGGLVDRSLVVREVGRRSRYRLLETVKLFAQQQCDDERSREIADLHAAWCLATVGTDPRRYVFDFDLADWCGDHHDDLRAAGRHLRATDRNDDAARILAASALAMHLDHGARASSTLELVERDLAAIDDESVAATLHFAGVMCAMASRSPEAIADHGTRGLTAARRTGDPVLVNIALVLASWSTVFADPELALEQTAEASDVAAAADEPRGREFGDSYRAIHLAVLRRYDEAEAVARSVVERKSPDERPWYPKLVGTTVLATLLCVDDPETGLDLAHEMFDHHAANGSMWGHDVVTATLYASAGDHATASVISTRVLDRLEHAGQDPWPDLLLPPIAHAVEVGEHARAAGWLDAMRSAGRPTQSFQATILYRRLRDAVDATSPEVFGHDIEAVGRAALAWLRESSSSVGSSPRRVSYVRERPSR